MNNPNLSKSENKRLKELVELDKLYKTDKYAFLIKNAYFELLKENNEANTTLGKVTKGTYIAGGIGLASFIPAVVLQLAGVPGASLPILFELLPRIYSAATLGTLGFGGALGYSKIKISGKAKAKVNKNGLTRTQIDKQADEIYDNMMTYEKELMAEVHYMERRKGKATPQNSSINHVKQNLDIPLDEPVKNNGLQRNIQNPSVLNIPLDEPVKNDSSPRNIQNSSVLNIPLESNAIVSQTLDQLNEIYKLVFAAGYPNYEQDLQYVQYVKDDYVYQIQVYGYISPEKENEYSTYIKYVENNYHKYVNNVESQIQR